MQRDGNRLRHESRPVTLSSQKEDEQVAAITIPQIRTTRLMLSILTASDIADVFAYCREPDVARLTSWHPHRTIADTQAFLDQTQQIHSAESGRVYCRLGIRLGQSPVIGCIDFHQSPAETGHIDYCLGKPYWNQGIMSEAATAVINWAFTSLPEIQAVKSCALSENIGSVRIMQKTGMVLETSRRVYIPKFGEERDGVFYVLSRLRWQKQA